MIPEAREVRLSRKDRKVLEASCRSPVTLQRDLKRARIVLLAATGRSTRSIAKEVGVQPRIVSRWRQRYADQGLEGLQDKPRPGKQPIYTKATDKRILKLLDKPPPEGFVRWTGPLLAEAPDVLDVNIAQRTTPTLRSKPPLDFINSVTAAFPNRKLHVLPTTSTLTRKTNIGSRPTPMCDFISRRPARRPAAARSSVQTLPAAVYPAASESACRWPSYRSAACLAAACLATLQGHGPHSDAAKG